MSPLEIETKTRRGEVRYPTRRAFAERDCRAGLQPADSVRMSALVEAVLQPFRSLPLNTKAGCLGLPGGDVRNDPDFQSSRARQSSGNEFDPVVNVFDATERDALQVFVDLAGDGTGSVIGTPV
jgi:hypothetical protein